MDVPRADMAVNFVLRNVTGDAGPKQFQKAEGKILFAAGVTFSICVACLFYAFVYYNDDDRGQPSLPHELPKHTGAKGGAPHQKSTANCAPAVAKLSGETHSPPLSPSWKMVYSSERNPLANQSQPVAWVPQPWPTTLPRASSARLVQEEPIVARVLTLL